MDEMDPEFGLVSGDIAGPVRLYYEPFAKSGIPVEAQDPQYIMGVCAGGKVLRAVTKDELLKDEDGNILHPGYDLHWSLAERTYGKPREVMIAKRERNAGKVGKSCPSIW